MSLAFETSFFSQALWRTGTVDDSQEQTGAKGLEALKDSATARHIMSRDTGSPGVIDIRHTQDHYSRLTERPPQRHGLLDHLKHRYDLSGDEPAGGSIIYATSQGQQQDADETFAEALPSTSAVESLEAPKKSAPAASAPPWKFRVSRKPNSTAGKPLQHNAPGPSQATTYGNRSVANNSRQRETSETAAPTVKSLASSSEIATNSTPATPAAVLRLSRKRGGKLDRKTSGPGIDESGSAAFASPDTVQDERESTTIADSDAVHQSDRANEPEGPHSNASLPVVSERGHDKTSGSSDSPAMARATVRRAMSETMSQASRVLSSKQSTLKGQSSAKLERHSSAGWDGQSSTKEADSLLLRKSRADVSTSAPQAAELESVNRASSADSSSFTDGSVETSAKGKSDERVAGEASRRHAAREISSAAIDGQAPEALPLVKAQPVAAEVQLKRAEDATENIGPASGADAGANHPANHSVNQSMNQSANRSANRSARALAVEMRPGSSRAQASGIVWRKSAGGESSYQDGPGSSERSVYSSSSSTSSASLPLTSARVQGQGSASVQRQRRGESGNTQAGSDGVLQRAEHGGGHGPSQAHGAAPEVDLERITEHVSRAIFRQLTVERERRGF
jgi:hypothetical protein